MESEKWKTDKRKNQNELSNIYVVVPHRCPHLVDVRATEVAVQRGLEVERSGAGVGHRQLSFERGPVQRDLSKASGRNNQTSHHRRVTKYLLTNQPRGGLGVREKGRRLGAPGIQR